MGTNGNPTLPSISIVMPTLNSERTLALSLDSILEQDYPPEQLEVILADGGSADGTIKAFTEFSSKFRGKTKVLPNALKTGEAGKAVGVKSARNDVVALIDSDNILPHSGWLRQMVEPFGDPEIIATEPIEYTYRPTDGLITRYSALLGMNDPLCLFLGNYDRFCTLTGKWTEMPVTIEKNGAGYLKVLLNEKSMPTIGANGFLIRREAFDQVGIGDYLFDIDVLYELAQKRKLKIAKVKTGIIHLFSDSLSTFAHKQRRRVRDYLYYNSLGIRKYPWNALGKAAVAKFILYTLTVLPLLGQSLRGYLRKPDRCWLFHPVACWVTLWEYGWQEIKVSLQR